MRDDAGILFEGAVVSELQKRQCPELKFWQDKNKNEVDIIFERDSTLLAIEVKFKHTLKAEDKRGLKAFCKEYEKRAKLFVVNLSRQEGKDQITYVLPYSLDSISNVMIS